MRYHTAPAAALKALETAARHLSFTRAAEELNITQSAVSHQIKHLEALWDVKLFDRRPRRLELTTAGRALAPIVREFFASLDEALGSIHREGEDNALRVETLPTFASKWLVPRRQDFRDSQAGTDGWLSTAIRETFDLGDADIAIHMSRGEYPAHDSWKLIDEFVYPVCRPKFLDRHGSPATPEDLCRFPLLLRHHEILTPAWEFWFAFTGVPESVYEKALREGTHFPDSNLALQAAFEGQGIALGRHALVRDDVASGRLVRLFPGIVCPFDLSYYVVAPRGRVERPIVAAFRDWVMAEAAAFGGDAQE